MSYFDAVYMDHELSPRAKTVCMYLHDRANREGESWYAINTIASDLGLSRSTVKRALGDLVRQGRVEKKPRYRKTAAVPPTFIGCCEKAQSSAKGGLRFLAGPGAGSSWPTQKAQ